MSDIDKLTTIFTEILKKTSQSSTTNVSNNTFDLKSPEPFDVQEPSKWSQWIRRFEVYRAASGLSQRDETQQINCLVYCLGSDADSLLSSIGLPPDKRETYEQVKTQFNDHFSVRKNLFYERTRFLQRNQEPNESIDCYINDLYKLVDRCEWSCGSCKFDKNILLLKLVSGLADRHLSTQLQLQKDLTLEDAILRIRQTTIIEKQQDIVRQNPDESADTHGIMKVTKSKKKLMKCQKCGKLDTFDGNHSSSCPAKNSRCHRCKQVGHWQPMCTKAKTNQANQVSNEGSTDFEDLDRDSGESFTAKLDTVCLASIKENNELFCTEVEVNGVVVRWKIDSGADVCVLSPEMATELNLLVKPTSRCLRGAGNIKLSVRGEARVTLRKNNVETKEDIFIVEGQQVPLLGKSAIITLGLIKLSINEIDSKSYEWINKYPNVFNGLGVVKGSPYVIKLSEQVKPFSVLSPRRVPIPLKSKLKAELEQMVDANVIVPISEATDWCSPIVVASKKNGSIRLCVDYTELNKFVVREKMILPSVDELLANIQSASVLSKLDAQSGFWQVEIDESSQKLTTFITPFGRFYFKRLPFGLTSAPEHFQKKMAEAIEGLEGVINLVDDFLVYGKDVKEHDERLGRLLKRLQDKGITLNKDKCEFRTNALNFLGHRLDNGQVKPDPEKVAAIQAVRPPQNTKDLRSFLGMVNYLMKFIPHLSDHAVHLRTLLSTKYEWSWTNQHQNHFDKIKVLVANAVALVSFDPEKATRVCADSSSFGLGAVLEQQYADGWRPVQFISRSLSDIERRYAQIEKEALALTWACERFSQFLTGLPTFELITDHLPLVVILGKKPIDSLSARLQRFRMRLLPFTFKISHEKGTNFFIPDILSRNPLALKEEENKGDILQEMETHVCDVMSSIPVTDRRLAILKKAQMEDSTCHLLKSAIENGDWTEMKGTVFYKERGDLVVHGDLILHGTRIYVPRKTRPDVLDSIHKGHQGISRCTSRARDAVWWPGMIAEIKQKVEGCLICIENSRVPCEPLIPSSVPERPWQVLGTDLLKYEGKFYLVIQDYFSKYIELIQVYKTDAPTLIHTFKSIFARHGIPQVIRSDNVPFNCKEIREFSDEYSFELVTSSPVYPRSNGQAERAVQIAKNILKKNQDPYEGLLAFRSTPLECGLSPAELLFGRKIRNTIPTSGDLLKPAWPDLEKVKDWNQKEKAKQKQNYDSRHNTRELRNLNKGEQVWVSNLKRYGTVLSFGTNRREYIVDVNGRSFRRNRIFLVPVNNRFQILNDDEAHEQPLTEDPEPIRNVVPQNLVDNRHGVRNSQRQIVKPKRYIEEF